MTTDSEMYPELSSLIIEVDTCTNLKPVGSEPLRAVAMTVADTFVPLAADEARELAMRLTLAAEAAEAQ